MSLAAVLDRSLWLPAALAPQEGIVHGLQ